MFEWISNIFSSAKSELFNQNYQHHDKNYIRRIVYTSPNVAKRWGIEAVLDVRGATGVTDKQNIINFVKELVEKIDMVAYGEPIVEHFATHDPDKAGFSLVQLIETSSITGHFVDKNGDFYLNVFSCKDFNDETVVEVVNKYFSPEHIEIVILNRSAR